jgi:hypothetical protein
MILLGFTLLAGTACKKDKDSTPGVGTPTKVCLITKDASSDGSYTNYVYNASNKITSSLAFNSNDTTEILSTYTYLGNKVTFTNNSQLSQTVVYYLNANGLADSAIATLAGLGEVNIINKYNSVGEPIETLITGEIFGTSIEQITTNQYSNGNKVKETTNDGSDVSITNYEFYLDKVNLSAKSEEAQEFNKANKNLMKKATYDDGSFDSYTYEFDADGKVTKTTTTNSDTGASSSQITWTCK